jgi:hypothetical protein
MRSSDGNSVGPAIGKARLPARVFYGVLLAGVLLGSCVCGTAAWAYTAAGDREPTSRLWSDNAMSLVVPVGVMVGATFGGITAFAIAVIWEKRRVRRDGT